MTHELIDIIESVKAEFTDTSDLLWTGYDSANEAREELNEYITQLRQGDQSGLETLQAHFWPSCTFQEHALMNGWSEKYMELSQKFDRIYAKIKKG
ncbi:hypothetical protein [Spirosoma litoris]